ncbi:MAG: hypothetical protein AAGI66_08625 [Cyanobacteria bacterium P01_H01_bin.74]
MRVLSTLFSLFAGVATIKIPSQGKLSNHLQAQSPATSPVVAETPPQTQDDSFYKQLVPSSSQQANESKVGESIPEIPASSLDEAVSRVITYYDSVNTKTVPPDTFVRSLNYLVASYCRENKIKRVSEADQTLLEFSKEFLLNPEPNEFKKVMQSIDPESPLIGFKTRFFNALSITFSMIDGQKSAIGINGEKQKILPAKGGRKDFRSALERIANAYLGPESPWHNKKQPVREKSVTLFNGLPHWLK